MSGPDQAGFAGAAHDLNNALQSIGASLNLIERRLPDDRNPEIGRLLHSAREQVAHAGSLVRRMLVDATPAEERLDLCTFVSGMASQIEAVIGEGIVLDLRADGAQQPVRCDKLRLQSGLLNTVLNARDAMGGDGKLTISVRRVELDGGSEEQGKKSGAYVEVAVIDTGEGMEDGFVPHAFEPFVTTKPAGQGTGLGLFQLRSFVERSRGFIRLDSRKGAGTSLAIFLPLVE